jgi:hypothetical protein
MINLRRLALRGTALANACTATIRTKLLKIGAAIVRNTRRVRVMLASSHPLKAVFTTAAHALARQAHPVQSPARSRTNGGGGSYVRSQPKRSWNGANQLTLQIQSPATDFGTNIGNW